MGSREGFEEKLKMCFSTEVDDQVVSEKLM